MKLIGAIVGGATSAMISGGPFFQSLYHFGVFLLCTFVCMTLGALLENKNN